MKVLGTVQVPHLFSRRTEPPDGSSGEGQRAASNVRKLKSFRHFNRSRRTARLNFD